MSEKSSTFIEQLLQFFKRYFWDTYYGRPISFAMIIIFIFGLYFLCCWKKKMQKQYMDFAQSGTTDEENLLKDTENSEPLPLWVSYQQSALISDNVTKYRRRPPKNEIKQE